MSVLAAFWLLTSVFAGAAQATSGPVPDEVLLHIAALKGACAAWPPAALSAAPTLQAPSPDTPTPPPQVRICHLVANPEGETVQSAVFGAAAMFAALSVAAILLGCLLALFRFGEHLVGAVLGRRRRLGRAETGDVA